MAPRIEHVFTDGVETKRCGLCQTYKPIDSYGYSKATWDNLRPTCKDCLKQNNMANKEKRTEYNKRYWKETKEAQTIKCKKWREENKDQVKENMRKWLANNAERKKEMDKKYRLEHLDEKRLYNANWNRMNYHRLKTQDSIAFAELKIKKNTSRRIREMLGQEKSMKCLDYVGCSLEKFRIHLETKFTDGMHWKNYGETINGDKKNAWHIDHIFPCSGFNLENPIEQRACFHYTNMRPLWWNENIVKLNYYDVDRKKIYLQKFIEIYIIP